MSSSSRVIKYRTRLETRDAKFLTNDSFCSVTICKINENAFFSSRSATVREWLWSYTWNDESPHRILAVTTLLVLNDEFLNMWLYTVSVMVITIKPHRFRARNVSLFASKRKVCITYEIMAALWQKGAGIWRNRAELRGKWGRVGQTGEPSLQAISAKRPRRGICHVGCQC